MATLLSFLIRKRTGKEKQRHPLTRFMPAEESDYPIKSPRYIAFERAAVALLCKQNLIDPNHITYFRFGLTLFLLFFSSRLSYLEILAFAAIGGLSDFFDGALARAASKKTRMGILLDPLADKFLALTLMGILVMRKVLAPIYMLLILLMEGHLLLIPILSWFHDRRKANRGGGDPSQAERDRSAFILRSQAVLVGKVKVHLYVYSFLSLLLGKAFESLLFLRAGNLLLITGITVGAIAFCTYILRWFKRPYAVF